MIKALKLFANNGPKLTGTMADSQATKESSETPEAVERRESEDRVWPSVFLPILDVDQAVSGFALQSRDGINDVIRRFDNAEHVDTRSQRNYHLNRLQELTEGRKCFVRFNHASLRDQDYRLFPHDVVIVEVSQPEYSDDELIRACRAVHESGYELSVCDYVVESAHQPLLDCIDYMRVDFPRIARSHQRAIMEASRHFGFAPLAENLQTFDQFEDARQMDYSRFQGNFFRQPEENLDEVLPASRTLSLRLLQVINDQEFQLDRIDELIRLDPGMAVRLLKYLNSPVFGLHREVSSIRQALTLLGHQPLRKWMSLVMVGELSRDKPSILMQTCLIRAHFCELVGERALPSDLAQECFLIGMLSLLDTILSQSMERILSQMPLSDRIQLTLLNHDSSQRVVLDLVSAIETADWSCISALSNRLKVDEHAVFVHYHASVRWAAEILADMR